MAKSKRTRTSSTPSHYVVPSLIGGGLAWLFSGSLGLGVIIVIAVVLGTWMGDSLKK